MTTSSNNAGEIGFIEDFSLADDRTIPLEQLIPGTEDYYYYHSLHYLNSLEFDKTEEMLKAWIDRYDRTGRVVEIEYRKNLLKYDKSPEKSLDYFKYQLGIYFDHQKETRDSISNLPVSIRIDDKQYKNFKKKAKERHTRTTNGFETCALPGLLEKKIDPHVLRHLLQRLEIPDIDKLPRYIISDLNHKNSSGFGSIEIHNRLTLIQLDECIKLKAELKNETAFINVYLKRLQPGADSDWQNDKTETELYLKRLWGFVSELDTSHNSLKVHVLYNWLKHSRDHGVYDHNLFETYIKIPKSAVYANTDYISSDQNRYCCADLSAVFTDATLFPPVINDEPLVRDYLCRIFVETGRYKQFIDYFNDIYLKECFAETMIVNNSGDMEKWYSMLKPSDYQALKERVDLDFSHSNKVLFDTDEEVFLDLTIKNIQTLIIKIFEINTENYYRENYREIGTDINLDGLIAGEERTETYSEKDLTAKEKRFDFPGINRPGVYVIEFIGNGKSSRAVIRKGDLLFHERQSVAGHVFTIFDENNNRLDNCSVILSGHEYKASKNGAITIPYSTAPGFQQIIIKHKEFACIDNFNHHSENYFLKAGIYTARESLIKHEKASVIIRPTVLLNDSPVTLKVLENPVLEITTTDIDGVSAKKEVNEIEFSDKKEFVFEFQVPDRLHNVNFSLTATVQNISRNEEQTICEQSSFSLNEINITDETEDIHFINIDGNYAIDLLGKSGEPLSDKPVYIIFKFLELKDEKRFSMQTDQHGRIMLDNLKRVERVRAEIPGGRSKSFNPDNNNNSYPTVIHHSEGEKIFLPFMKDSTKNPRNEFSLFELRGGVYYKDCFSNVSIKNSYFCIDKLLPGDYEFYLKQNNHVITIRTAGASSDSKITTSEGYIMNAGRHIECTDNHLIQIGAIKQAKNKIEIGLMNFSETARVQIFATSYLPGYSVFDSLNKVQGRSVKTIKKPVKKTVYISGRDIGDEYRYILDRKYAEKYAGNMLSKPELLLSPWTLGKTDTGKENLSSEEEWEDAGAAPIGAAAEESGLFKSPAGEFTDIFSCLDFLKKGTVEIFNLQPDKNGIIKIDREKIKDKSHIHIVAVDNFSTAYKTASVSKPDCDYPEVKNISLWPGLNPSQHYTQQNRTSIVHENSTFSLKNISTSEFSVSDNPGKVFQLFFTISTDSVLSEFSFVTEWPDLSQDEKREKYSEFACHELNFFIFKKDPDFFKDVVFPHINNKKDKTFIDNWLISTEGKQAVSELLSEYLLPWNYSQLNIVEKILLSKSIDGEAPPTLRHVKDLLDLLPSDTDNNNFLFNTAIKGGELDAEDGFGFSEAVKEAKIAPPAPSSVASKRSMKKLKQAAPIAEDEMLCEMEDALSEDEMLCEMEDALFDKEIEMPAIMSAGGNYYDEDDDLLQREQTRMLYQALDKTEEFAENNYYHLPIELQIADLITVNDFWLDFAKHDNKNPFFSTHFTKASNNFSEMMFALSLLDLPFKEKKHDVTFTSSEAKMDLVAGSSLIAFHREILETEEIEAGSHVLLNQNFFMKNDRYIYEDGEQYDKFVTDEFLTHVVYGCQIVITNPSSSQLKLNILTEIPQGAVPVSNGMYTKTTTLDLYSYTTETIEYFFYFPESGTYNHFPVHAAINEKPIAFTTPFIFNVVKTLSKTDTTTWDYISQFNSDDDVIKFIDNNNIERLNLDRIAFRMKDKAFFNKIIKILEKRHVYNHTLYSYSIFHNDTQNIRQYLQFSDNFLYQTGEYINCSLAIIDPIIRKTYQHLEYRPLVNPRIHRLGKQPAILNEQLNTQYHKLLKILSYKNRFDDDDLMAITYYLLLQDRIEEAGNFFSRVNPDNADTKLQYDYFATYLSYSNQDFDKAGSIARNYLEYPVDRWEKLFTDANRKIQEVTNSQNKNSESDLTDKSRTERQINLADTEPSFNFVIEKGEVILNCRNISDFRVSFYLMDIELLFSRNPFVQEVSGNFSNIMPDTSKIIQLSPDQREHRFDLPEKYRNSNVMVGINSRGIKKSQGYYANRLNIHVVDNYGIISVRDKTSDEPLSTVYTKVYAKFTDGNIQFYKDGYTDPSGRFDYTSLNTNELDNVEKFSILILSDSHGAVVREATPPKR